MLKTTCKWAIFALLICCIFALAGLAGCNKSKKHAVVPVEAKAGNTFSPQMVNAKPEDKVKWTNLDTVKHSIIPDVAGVGPDSTTDFPSGIPAGGTFTWTVPSNATTGQKYYYHDPMGGGTSGGGTKLGTGMAGVIVVD